MKKNLLIFIFSLISSIAVAAGSGGDSKTTAMGTRTLFAGFEIG